MAAAGRPLEEGVSPNKAGGSLTDLKLSELKQRARSNGVTQDELDGAGDAEDEKVAVIKLIEEKMRQKEEEDGLKEGVPPNKAGGSLTGLKYSELVKVARSNGVTQDELDVAGDAEDVKVAVIKLIEEKMRQKEEEDRSAQSEADCATRQLKESLATLQLALEAIQIRSELLQRARAERVTQDALDTAGDAEDVNASIIKLIMEKMRLQGELELEVAAAVAADAREALNRKVEEERGELKFSAKVLSELVARARELGVTQNALDEAGDAKSETHAVIELILHKRQDTLKESMRQEFELKLAQEQMQKWLDFVGKELKQLKKSELVRYARSVEVTQDALDEAGDLPVLIKLIVEKLEEDGWCSVYEDEDSSIEDELSSDEEEDD